MTVHSEMLLKNVSSWAPFCPKEASKLLELIPQNTSLCRTDRDEPNIKRNFNGVERFFHSTANAAKEAEDWFASLNFYQAKALFVYGVGMGYYFRAAKDWLKEDSERRLIFFEDDLEVVYHLFQTEIGREILSHEQVLLFFLEKDDKGNILSENFENIPSIVFLHQYVFSCLKLYGEVNHQVIQDCSTLLGYFKNYKTFELLEQLTYGGKFFSNYYSNILELPQAKFADAMFGKFQGVPAIICGAGPSLDKNQNLLESLSQNALVIAGGSAMNTVNVNGWLPHLGITVDPNLSQYSRMFMNQSYEVPYFFRNRVFPEALRLLHGEHLYVSGSGGYGIANWFETQLGIQGKELEEGTNVVTFGIALAHALGCSPIILVGVDMAYTNQKSYAAGILQHPILDFNQSPRTKCEEEEIVEKNDIFGKPVHTLWKWIQESVWISQFCMTKPGIEVINATEGGIGAEGIPNETLESVKKHYLNHSADFDALLHIRIQESCFDSDVQQEFVIEKMHLLIESLKQSKIHCLTLIKEFMQILEILQKGEEDNPQLITDNALAALKALNQEEAFKAILSRFNESFLSFFAREDMEQLFQQHDQRIDQKAINTHRTKLNIRRYKFLKSVCNENITRIQTALKDNQIRSLISEGMKEKSNEIYETHLKDAENALKRFQSQTYEASVSSFHIDDKDLGIEFTGELYEAPVVEIHLEGGLESFKKFQQEHPSFTGVIHYKEADGRLISEQNYQEGVLHGPSIGYFSNGEIACRSFFVNGCRQGKSLYFYRSGYLYALKSYLEGRREGTHDYFYENGCLKSSSLYADDKLNGEFSQYFSSGVLKRKICFVNGLREGREIIWNLGGIKEIEMNYMNNKPVGFQRSWHLTGQLAREILYDENGKFIHINGWSSEGIKLPAELMMREDYFDKVSKQAEKLAGSLENVMGFVNQIVPELDALQAKDNQSAFVSDMNELAEEMKHLKEIYKQIEAYQEQTSEEAKEALWKTPETQKILGQQLNEIAEKMTDDIGTIKHSLSIINQLLKNKQKDEESSV